MIQRKNIWPFGDSTKTTTVYRGRGVSSKSSGIRSALKYKGLSRTASGVKYKGYHVWDDENGWHTSLDPGSWFDSKKDVTRLIDSWEKDRKNPLPLSAGSMILGPSEKWLKKHGVMRRGNPVKYTTKAFDALTAKAQQAQQEYSREFGKTGVLKGRALSLYKKWVGLVRKADEMREAGIDEYLDSARRNPETESADSFQKFHGFNAKEQITVEKDVHYHSNLWAVGKLEKLEVISPDGEQVMLNGFKGAILSANEDNTQLYIEGGDQGVDLSEFGIGKPYHDKEDLGEVKKLFYFTNKTHLGDQGGEAIYHHTLGEERTKRNYLFGKLKGRKVPRPRLVYDVMNQALEIIGGEYVIEPEGIKN